jgi:tetrahydromethanopterin S-methyltransferase subunit F
MGMKRASTFHNIRGAASLALGFTFAVALVLISAMAAAQEQTAPGQKARENESFMATVGRWFEEQTANARKKVESFGSAASDAAKTTVEGARDAADAVARIPTARAVSGHEKCLMAPNGAPDCVSAANTICKARGFDSGKSVDMTTSEVCPAKVYISGRSTGPECKTETFVSRALCQ